MIEIITKGGRRFTYDKSKYQYHYDGKAILIFKGGEIVAIYNLDAVSILSTE